jgi:predicted DNA-binding protein
MTMKNEVFATKLPAELKKQLDAVCVLLGVKKSYLVEEAIREKLEDLLDSYDLRQAMKEATGFHALETLKKETPHS